MLLYDIHLEISYLLQQNSTKFSRDNLSWKFNRIFYDVKTINFESEITFEGLSAKTRVIRFT